MSRSHFDVLILIGRPASGKSEIIDFLNRLPTPECARYHISTIEVSDDFPMLWAWLEEDDFAALAHGESGLVAIGDQRVPFVIFPNEDDVTTGKPGQLEKRLEAVLDTLWGLYFQSGRAVTTRCPGSYARP